ncbi:VWA domain-containing protein [Mycobacterium sp. PS03-16]|uniref:VWA domain-containing protein n=1 Tax=Mycobacterium sp. PS03-16 TaxID=2559611 RepID=UPI0010745E87|nr:VWA domain-containing protein [Mycobacterium sp. PS03-16]TFV60249.1 VWA domain-containing protein [Mycobacterium sp. PS03-16]
MTNPDVTLLAALLDRSGSMQTSKQATEDGWRELINEQRGLPGECYLTLAQFDTVYERLYECVPIADVPEFVVEPRGRTALLDAAGKFITEVGAHLAGLPEERRPGQVICLIMTDGMENASHEWTWSAVRTLITQQRDQWQWQFVFIGANMDAVHVGGRMGIAEATSITYDDADYDATRAVTDIARDMVGRMRRREPAAFSEADRRAAMGEATT